MPQEELITKILGEHTQEEGKVASRVLSYVTENPDWQMKEALLYKDKIILAISTALCKTFGHDITYYVGRDRRRELVEVRYMVFLLLREETDYSYNDIGKIFKKNHSTVMFGEQTAKDLIQTYRPFREDYQTFKNAYLSLI